MRALAEFIMRGRAQASVVALIGSWFPLTSPATVALVSLRRGSSDGLLILLWAALPALITFAISDMGPLMTMVTVAGLLLTYVAALLLRVQPSWPKALMGLVGMASLCGFLLAWAEPDPVATMTEALGEMLQQMQSQAPAGAAVFEPSATFVVGLMSYVIALNALFSLCLARWWQAALYNPGGFQAEFHQLRLSPVQALVCLAAMVYCWQQGNDYHAWSSLFGLPLLVAGISLVHYTVKARKFGGQWLVLFYLALLLFNPLTLGLMVVATLDTWINFRSRIGSKSSKEG
ncbi:MAG: hypothetical protein AseanaTS_09340 [Candidatus Pelagadaptatus aseana]|uniref:hypothetical protein n=1 Tax=Candidatus Pelagadaptatus aseana TaxID=3120508 RepID=UPI0039B13E99